MDKKQIKISKGLKNILLGVIISLFGLVIGWGLYAIGIILILYGFFHLVQKKTGSESKDLIKARRKTLITLILAGVISYIIVIIGMSNMDW